MTEIKLTDEEIEKAFECCKTNDSCGLCPCLKIAEKGINCRKALMRYLYNYIQRLKAEIARLQRSDASKEQYTIDQHAEIHKIRDDIKRLKVGKEQVRKETAKKVISEIIVELLNNSVIDDDWDITDFEYGGNEIQEALETVAKRHGVEVDE